MQKGVNPNREEEENLNPNFSAQTKSLTRWPAGGTVEPPHWTAESWQEAAGVSGGMTVFGTPSRFCSPRFASKTDTWPLVCKQLSRWPQFLRLG
jgi:hypothetical protein